MRCLGGYCQGLIKYRDESQASVDTAQDNRVVCIEDYWDALWLTLLCHIQRNRQRRRLQYHAGFESHLHSQATIALPLQQTEEELPFQWSDEKFSSSPASLRDWCARYQLTKLKEENNRHNEISEFGTSDSMSGSYMMS